MIVLGLAAVLIGWGLLFPVHLGWAARLAIARALPADGPLQLGVEAVTFRWRWGQPALTVEVRGIAASARGRPLASLRELVVELPKSGLWRRHFAASQITLREPHLTLDLTPDGALAIVAPPSPAKPVAPPAGPPDLKPFALILPAAGESLRLTIEQLAVQLRTQAGEARVPFGRSETTLAHAAGGTLQLDLALPLMAGTPPPSFTARVSLDPRTGRTEFTVKLPAFATTDLPVLPGAPPLPLQATIALDATGHFDLATGKLTDVAGGVSVINGDVFLPDPNKTKLRVERVELRGRADLGTQRAILETGRVRIGDLDINVVELETTLGATMQSRWQIEIAGLKGSAILPLLPADLRQRLPLSDEAINLLALTRATTRGTATVARDTAGAFSSKNIQAEGRVEIALGREPFVAMWSARQAEHAELLTLDVALPAFVPARWPAALLAGTPAGALDLPLALTAQATLTPAGEPRSARVAFTGAAGTLQPLQPGMPPLAVRSFEVRVETEQFDRAWRVPVARLELANGAIAELAGLQAALSPTQFTAQGELRASGLTGEFAAPWLPAGSLAPLVNFGLAPRDLGLSRITTRFTAKAIAQKGGGWQPAALTATTDLQLRLRAVPLALTAQVTLPESGSHVEATLDLAEVRVSQLGLPLVEGLTTAAFDFPVSLHASARANLKGELAAAGVRVLAGPGRVRTPPQFGDVDVALKSITLDASFDPVGKRAIVKTLAFDAGGLRANVGDLTATIAPPHVVSGRLGLEPFAMGTLLALWPASQQPELRRTVQTTLRAGEFLGAQFDFGVTLDPSAKPALNISRFQGTARLGQIEAQHSSLPGAVTIAGLKATVDYPQATLELEKLTVPGASVPAARAQVSALNTPAPTASLTASFEADLVAANQAWKFAAPGLLSGSTRGELSVQAPFTADPIDIRAALDLTRAKVTLRNFPDATPDVLSVSARLSHVLSADLAPTAEFSMSAGKWLDAPLALAGRVTLTAGDRRPSLIELTNYEHGRTRLQARVALPSATHQEISLTGAYLDLVPLLRAGLAAADALAARVPAASSPTPTAAAPATPAAPAVATTMTLDVRVDQIEFGPGQNAAQFELRTQLKNNVPSALTFQALAGAGNALRADLAGPADHQVFKLTIGDAAGWMRTLTAPWSVTPPAPGQFGSLVAQLVKIPTMVSGGGVSLDMDLRPGETDWLRGRLRLTRATMLRPPRVVQLLALKSGNSFQKSPFIEEFSIGQVTLSKTLVSVSAISLVGSGLVDRLKVNSASYGLADERLKMDGEYFGVGFEVVGTRADPQIFLKDSNKLIRAIGVRNEFDFDEPAPKPAPKPPPPKPKAP